MNGFLGSGRERIFHLFCALVVIASAAAYDAYLWVRMDRFQAPIRAAVLDDQEYYGARIHRAQEADHPINAPYYLEHEDGPSRYVLLESASVLMSRITGVTNASAWAAMLRPLTALLLFIVYAFVFRNWGAMRGWMPSALAAGVVLWQFTHSITVGSALLSWFAPFVTAGIVLAAHSLTSARLAASGLASLASVVAFSLHPIAFVTGTVSSAVGWARRFFMERTPSVVLRGAIFCLIASAFATLCFFGIVGGNPTGPAADEAMRRTPAFATRLLPMPIETMLLAAATALMALNARRLDGRRRAFAWHITIFLGVATLGTWWNLFTGTYFLNTHFRALAVFALPIGAALSLQAEPRRTRASASIGAVSLVLLSAYGIALLFDHPFRSWLILGKYVPWFLSYLVIASTVLGLSWKSALDRARPAAAVAILLVSAAYAGLFQWRNNRHFMPTQASAQSARGLLTAMSDLPPGVIMADHEASGLISLQAPQHPYWYYWGSIDEATQEELIARWKDMLVMYPDAKELRDAVAWRGLFNLSDAACFAQAERLLYAPLRDRGVIERSLCLKPREREDMEAFFRQGSDEATLARTAAWRPVFRADYALFDKKKGEQPPEQLRALLHVVYEDERYLLLRFVY